MAALGRLNVIVGKNCCGNAFKVKGRAVGVGWCCVCCAGAACGCRRKPAAALKGLNAIVTLCVVVGRSEPGEAGGWMV